MDKIVSIYTIIALVVILLITLIFVVIKSRKIRKLESKNSSLKPYKCGKDFGSVGRQRSVAIPFDTILVSLDDGTQKTAFDLLNDFWDDPAEVLNGFYFGDKFGLIVPVVSIQKLNNKEVYVYVTETLSGAQYIIASFGKSDFPKPEKFTVQLAYDLRN